MTYVLLAAVLVTLTLLALAFGLGPVLRRTVDNRDGPSTPQVEGMARALEPRPYPPAFTRLCFAVGIAAAVAGCGGAGARAIAPAYATGVKAAKKLCEYVEELPDALPMSTGGADGR